MKRSPLWLFNFEREMILMPLLLPGISGAVEPYPTVPVGGIAEPAGGAFDLFDE